MTSIGRLLALLVLLTCSGCKTTQTVYKMSVAANPAIAAETSQSGGAVTFEAEGIWGGILPLDYTELDNPSALESRWNFENPFAGLYAENHEPIIFYLIMENRSDVSVSFNPSSSFSLYFGGAPLFAIEYDDLYQLLYHSGGQETQLANIKKMLFKSHLTLLPGEHARGLLFFRRPDAAKRKSQELLFRIERIHVGKEDIEFLLPFVLTMEKIEEPKP